MSRDLVEHKQTIDCRLSLAKGEGRVRVEHVTCREGRTPHLNPFPLMKGRGGHFASR